jgi:hypothetical protein
LFRWKSKDVREPSADSLPHAVQMMLPCRWRDGGLERFSGRVRYRRRFSWLARLDSHERVWLTCAGADSRAEFWLNGGRLGADAAAPGPFEFEISDLLRPRNQLQVEVEGVEDTGGLWGEVAVEIRCPAFLRDVKLELSDSLAGTCLVIAGKTVGNSDRPLELYVLLDGSTIIYERVQPIPEGSAFRFVSGCLPTADPPTVSARRVKVDLINGASAWHTIDRELPCGPAADDSR